VLDVAHQLGDRVARPFEILEEAAGMVSAAIASSCDVAGPRLCSTPESHARLRHPEGSKLGADLEHAHGE
jgi:hypothetical protein